MLGAWNFSVLDLPMRAGRRRRCAGAGFAKLLVDLGAVRTDTCSKGFELLGETRMGRMAAAGMSAAGTIAAVAHAVPGWAIALWLFAALVMPYLPELWAMTSDARANRLALVRRSGEKKKNGKKVERVGDGP